MVFGAAKGVLFIEVFSFRGVLIRGAPSAFQAQTDHDVHVGVAYIGRLEWFVVDEYYCSETTTTQVCLGYISLGPHRATIHDTDES